MKQRFELAMDQAEEDAVSRGLDVCGLYRIRDHLDGRHSLSRTAGALLGAEKGPASAAGAIRIPLG